VRRKITSQMKEQLVGWVVTVTGTIIWQQVRERTHDRVGDRVQDRLEYWPGLGKSQIQDQIRTTANREKWTAWKNLEWDDTGYSTE